MFKKARKLMQLARFMAVQRTQGYDVPSDPHFDDASTTWFRERLKIAGFYLEYGSGGSTLLADRLGKPAMSIENDHFFAAAVRKRLSASSSVSIHAIDIGLTGPWGVPIRGRPNARRVARWRRYVEAPFNDGTATANFPDLVLVDGRFRRACALEVTRQAQQRGAEATIMFDDYASEGRGDYAAVEVLLGTPQRIGRAAIFETRLAAPVSQSAIEEAFNDYR